MSGLIGTRHLKAVLAMLADEGITVLAIESGQRHYKLRIQTPAGPRLLVCSRNSGDWRCLPNLLRTARRIMREAAPRPY